MTAEQLVALHGVPAAAAGSDAVELPAAGPAASAYLVQTGA